MESFGSEVGQKMRSAVKAKLIELGTGGSAGYIDDELPDYVMIMVANKRSKEQMIADLNLFLGTQTELFVTWLHEVLQKLQEVTLPATVAKKRKIPEKDELPTKKDKKSSKKDKKSTKKINEEKSVADHVTTTEKSATTTGSVAIINSITDVFAEDLLQKAKKSNELNAEAINSIKKNKDKRANEEFLNSELTQKTNDFDIPTISEISSTTGSGNGTNAIRSREEDLAELAHIQKKIYAAKKQLKQVGKKIDSDDEDFLNLKDDESVHEFDELGDLVKKNDNSKSNKRASPIIFDKETVNNQKSEHSTPYTHSSYSKSDAQHAHGTDDNSRNISINKINSTNKRPVHERLGTISNSNKDRLTKDDNKITFDKRNERHSQKNNEMHNINDRRKDITTTTKKPTSDNYKNSRLFKLALPENDKHSHSNPDSNTQSQRHRIGSRVIVATNKLKSQISQDDLKEKPVNSVVKIKPRPILPPNKQACKSLLLRAVAEAQRSTIITKNISRDKTEKKISTRLGVSGTRNTKLYTKSYSNKFKNRTSSPPSSFFKRTQNFVIEVDSSADSAQRRNDENEADKYAVEEEYEPKCIFDGDGTEEDYVYVPNEISKSNENIDAGITDEWNLDNIKHSKTQFVVTLNDKKKFKKRVREVRSQSFSPLPQVTSSSGSRKNIDEVTSSSNSKNRFRVAHNNPRKESKKNLAYEEDEQESINSQQSSNTPPTLRRNELIEIFQKPNNVKKIIIKNDSEEDVSPKKKILEPQTKSKSDNSITETIISDRSTTPPLPTNESSTIVEINAQINTRHIKKHTPIEYDIKKETRKSEQQQCADKTAAHKRIVSVDAKTDATEFQNHEDSRKILIRTIETKKYDNIPSLNSVALNIAPNKIVKPKERCKYHPNCTKQFCEYYHPTTICKSFPNCKFVDKCIYTHPKCKFDMSCTNIDCNFAHSGSRNFSTQLTAPPLSSHVVPVQNYKSISALTPSTTAMCMCKYYPNCSKLDCTFYHPKPCRFGKNCINKLECNFYHHEQQSSNKFKWVASVL